MTIMDRLTKIWPTYRATVLALVALLTIAQLAYLAAYHEWATSAPGLIILTIPAYAIWATKPNAQNRP